MNGITYGYARVSTKEQNLDRQLRALSEFGVEDGLVFKDKASGKDFERPAYRKLMRRLKPGDVLVVKSIDRLGRNYSEILEEWRRITREKRAAIVVLDMPLLDTRENDNGVTGEFLADLILQVLSYVAQVERENIRQRQAEGIAAAQARGVRFGRPMIEMPAGFDEVLAEYESGAITRRQAAERLGVSAGTFDAWKKSRRRQCPRNVPK